MKSFRFQSIRMKLIGALVLIVALPTILEFYRYSYQSNKLLEQEVYSANQELVEQAVWNMNLNAEKMLKALYLVDSELLQIYANYDIDWDYQNYESIKRVIQSQSKMQNIRSILLDSSAFIIFIDHNGNAVTTLNNFNKETMHLIRSETWYKATLMNKGFPFWMNNYKLPADLGYVDIVGRGYVIGARTLNGLNTNEDFGVGVIGMPVQQFFQVSSTSKNASTFMLWDGSEKLNDIDGQLSITLTKEHSNSLRNEPNVIKKLDIGKQTYMANVAPIQQIGVSLVSLVPMEQFNMQLKQSQRRSLITILLVYVIASMVFIFLVLRLTKPLYLLLKSINRLGKGNFNTKVAIKGNDEIALLGNNFNRMVAKLEESIKSAAEEERKKEEAHFQALQAQINPHFLFNTLNSIKMMAMLSKTNSKVSDMITALGRLMEFSMRQDTVFISLREEIQYLELYMTLQKIRYHDDIKIETHIDESLLDSTILKFSLQPLIENSIIHAERLPLHIWIEAEIIQDELYIYIRDNGKGISCEKLQTIQNQLVLDHAKYSGIGLLNIDRRMKIHYGQNYGIDVINLESGGLQVTVHVPFRKEISL